MKKMQRYINCIKRAFTRFPDVSGRFFRRILSILREFFRKCVLNSYNGTAISLSSIIVTFALGVVSVTSSVKKLTQNLTPG